MEVALEHINISLPPELRALVQQQATAEQRSFAGQIRFLLDSAVRRANGVAPSPPPPPTSTWGPVLPNIQGNAKAIAQARGRIEQYQAERAQIERQRRRLNGSAAADARDQELIGWIHLTERRIEIAKRQVRSAPNNGGSSAV
jgi:hypothetical protein